jgi:hypothetical protein
VSQVLASCSEVFRHGLAVVRDGEADPGGGVVQQFGGGAREGARRRGGGRERDGVAGQDLSGQGGGMADGASVDAEQDGDGLFGQVEVLAEAEGDQVVGEVGPAVAVGAVAVADGVEAPWNRPGGRLRVCPCRRLRSCSWPLIPPASRVVVSTRVSKIVPTTFR